VTSVSWPTAEIPGTGDPAIARATTSWLNDPEILDRATATADENHVDPFHLGNRSQPARDIERGAFALDSVSVESRDVRSHTGGADFDDVAHRGARRVT
jgi:hypothetical protein